MTVVTDIPDTVTYRPGYPALLDALHETVTPGRLVASAGGHVLASRAALPAADDGPLDRFGMAWSTVRPPAGGCPDAFTRGLLDLHALVLRGALGYAMTWLDGRTAEGSTLLARQLNQGACADAAVEISECEAMCRALDAEAGALSDAAGAGADTRALVGRRLVEAGRTVLDLLGASGFLSDGVAADLYLAELAGNVYLHPGTETADAHLDRA